MSKVKIQGSASGTGIFTVAAPATNTDRTITLPDATSTLMTTNGGNFTQNIGIALDGYPALKFRNAAGADKAEIYVGTGAGDLNVVVNAQAAISVDSSARVRMPYQPMFTVVQPTVATSVGANPNYYFSGYTIINNVGNHFNNSTGSFTAPVTGNYLFRFLIMGADNGNSSSPHCGFSINGNANTGGGSYANNGMWEHPNNANHKTDTMHIIRMTANDTIRAMSLHSGISQPDRTYFMGVLIG